MFIYLHQKSLSHKISQTINFMNLKFKEYDELKKEAEILLNQNQKNLKIKNKKNI